MLDKDKRLLAIRCAAEVVAARSESGVVCCPVCDLEHMYITEADEICCDFCEESFTPSYVLAVAAKRQYAEFVDALLTCDEANIELYFDHVESEVATIGC